MILDFSMDLVSICLAGKLCRLRVRKGRAVAGAVFGAAFSLAATLISPGKYFRFALSIVCSLVMVLVAFGRGGVIRVLRRAVVLWAAAGLVGGVVSLLSSLGTGRGGKLSFVSALAVSSFVVFIMARVILRRPVAATSYVKVSFSDRIAAFPGLVDSGNLLRDPFSGAPVIIVSCRVAEKLFRADELSFLTGETDEVPQTLVGRARVIPSRTVGSEELLRAVKPDSVTVDGIPEDALVAPSTTALEPGQYDGIVPSSVASQN